MKEILDLLEERVRILMDEMETLRRENDRLRKDLAANATALAEENAALKAALDQERNTREAAALRIEALVQRLTGKAAE